MSLHQKCSNRWVLLPIIVLINLILVSITLAQTLPLPEEPVEYRLVEGDMMLPVSVIEGRATYQTNQWTNGIVPYVFHSSVNSTNQNRLIAAMNEWSSVAGITFVPRTTQANYIEFINSGAIPSEGTGNWSYVGMIGGRQYLSMYNWDWHYIIMHELAHALGVWHEQSRPDRDTYVSIQWQNIISGTGSNFNLQAGAGTVGSYDFASIMHYDDYAFSANGQPTIVAKPGYESYQGVMGNRSYLTETDKTGMRHLYPRVASYDTNLVNNSNFSGFGGWGSAFSTPHATYTWNGGYSSVGYLGFHGVAGQPMGVIYQNINQNVMVGDIVELRVMLGNPSPSNKHLRVHLHHNSSSDPWSDAAVCDFYPTTGGHRLEYYVIRRKITSNWTDGMRVWVESRPADSQPDIWMTSVTVRRLPGNSLNLTGTQCFSPSSQTDWDFTTGPQGWRTGHGMAYGTQISNGMSYPLTAADAWLESPSMVNVSANTYRYLKVEMASTSTCAQVYFQEYGKVWFEGSRHVSLTTIPDGQMRTYTFDMASNGLWTGNIGQLRLDTNCNEGYNASNANQTTIKRVWLTNTTLSDTNNLLNNPSFESGSSPWITNNSAQVKRVAKKPRTGYYSMAVTRTTASTLNFSQTLSTNALEAGHIPNYSVSVSASAANIPFQLRVRYTFIDGSISTRKCILATAQTTHRNYGCTSPTLTQSVRSVRFTVFTSAGSGKLWVDDALLRGDITAGMRDGESAMPDSERGVAPDTFRLP